MSSKLNRTEELDFHYLLGLMPPLQNEQEFAWLPELFSIIGHERLIRLCKYAGGETIKIPTLYQLSDSIDALQIYYDVYVTESRKPEDIPDNLKPLVDKILEVFNAEKG